MAAAPRVPGEEHSDALRVYLIEGPDGKRSGRTPTRGSDGAAGYDLYAAHDALVPARGKALVRTDLALGLPRGTYGRIAPRSGLAWKHHVDVGAGVIDPDYRGNVGVVLFNHAAADLPVRRGDRVAQLILERHLVAPRVLTFDAPAPAPEPAPASASAGGYSRGTGGFGSTGR